MTAPDITIYVRHSAGCKHADDETWKRCDCKKWLRWTVKGKRQRKPADTRSWVEAEERRREIGDQLAGRNVVPEGRGLADAIDVFLTDKRIQGVAPETVRRLECELRRLAVFCEGIGVFTVQAITREVLTRYCGTWAALYPSSVTRSKVRERCRTFLRYCFEAEWLSRIPALPKIRVDEPPTMPLTRDEFARLLNAIPLGLPDRQSANARVRVRGLFLLMRWSGLSVRDALCLPRAGLRMERGVYRVVTQRQKTGTDVSVPIPPDAAKEILAVPNSNAEYLFWTCVSSGGNHATKWGERFIRPVFEAAGLYDEEMHMVIRII